MATVYLAEDLKHHRKVAVKVLRPELAAALGPERFLREIEIAAGLTHPHILMLIDSGEAGGFLYYVMPYIEGESLRDRLDREKQLPVEDALQIARDVAAALSDAHSHDVIHRDIKPENILLSGGEAVVADFGIARAISAAGGEQLTGTGVSIGTPAYMSPEQATGEGQIDGRSDLYSLGCMLYEMLAGEPPHTGPTAQAIIAKRITQPAPRVTTVRETVPGPVADALERALARLPADRYATAAQFAEALHPATAPAAAAGKKRRNAMAYGAIAILAIVGAYTVISRTLGPPEAAVAAESPKLAVLPFENLGSSEDDYFADGITEEITSRIAEIGGLRVISRTSAMQYENHSKTLRQVGEELGVEYVLEGTIRTDRAPGGAGQVRVTPQLIRVADDAHLWTDRYTVDLVPGEIFRVQADIAEQVAQALDVALLEPERRALAERPTDNLEAYDYYLRGLTYARRALRRIEDSRLAAEMFERAAELDPTYVEAYAALAETYGHLFDDFGETSAGRKAGEAADRARELADGRPESHMALGWYHYLVAREFAAAERHFTAAQRKLPSNADLLVAIGDVQVRQGKWEEASVSFKRAVDLDPRSESALVALGRTYYMMRRYVDAENYLNRAVELFPDNHWAHFWKMMLYLTWDGSDIRAREALQAATDRADLLRFLLVSWDFDDQMVLRIFADHFVDALNRRTLRDPGDSATYYLVKAHAFRRNKQPPLAGAYFDSARVVLEPLVRARPTDGRLRARLGIAYAGLGRIEDARNEGELAVDVAPPATHGFMVSYTIPALAQIYVMIGEYDAAIDQLEQVLSLPSIISRPLLRFDTLWDPLRELPRFRSLVEDG